MWQKYGQTVTCWLLKDTLMPGDRRKDNEKKKKRKEINNRKIRKKERKIKRQTNT